MAEPIDPSIPETVQTWVISLELISLENDLDGEDPALVKVVGDNIVHIMQQEGYTPQNPIYTGAKGGFLVEFLTTMQQVATFIQDNHIAISEGIADLSGLTAIFGSVLPILKGIQRAHERQVGKEESMIRPIKITVEVDKKPITIETSDIAETSTALKLAIKYASKYPTTASQVNTKDTIAVKGQVPPRKRKRRR